MSESEEETPIRRPKVRPPPLPVGADSDSDSDVEVQSPPSSPEVQVVRPVVRQGAPSPAEERIPRRPAFAAPLPPKAAPLQPIQANGARPTLPPGASSGFRRSNISQPTFASGSGAAPRQAPFASSAASFSFNGAKNRAFAAMQGEQMKLGFLPAPKPIATPAMGFRPPPSAAELLAQAERLALNRKANDAPLPASEYLSEEASTKALRELVETTCDMEGVDMSDAMPANMPGCTLLKHQIAGVYWLKDREKGRKHGGILADDMGLGKTIQIIALICANQNTTKSSKSKSRATLVVCPVSLMTQWEEEINSKTNKGLRVLVHHGSNRTQDPSKLERYDVVITSYNTAVSEWLDPKPRATKAKEGATPKRVAKVKEESGALFQAEFFRIVLDEAHVIKDRTTKMHKACCDLTGYNRWVLTGTPIQNTIQDLHSLFEFLGDIVKPMNEFTEFKTKIMVPIKAGRGKLAMQRLSIILKAVLLRRTKTTMIDGKPLIVLPAREVFVISVPFADADERAFYDAVDAKMQLTLNSFLKAGTMNSNYTNVLILLLRLRQATSHPSLVAGKATLDGIDIVPAANTASKTAEEEEQEDAPVVDDGLDDIVSGLGALDVKSNVEAVVVSLTCALCEKPTYTIPAVASIDLSDSDEDKPKDSDDEDEVQAESKMKAAVQSAYCKKCHDDLGKFGNLKFSTKIRQTMRILRDISEEEGNKKTIIFSQFTSMLDLLEPFLKKAKIKFVRFDGKMNKVQKEAALNTIRRHTPTTVILISIKCGSVGLNLTACCRVILLDLWWNPAIQEQAFDRAHRFGQTEDVKIYIPTISGTIEDRLLTLQKTKSETAKAALDGGALTSSKLSTADIMYLFRGNGEGQNDGARA